MTWPVTLSLKYEWYCAWTWILIRIRNLSVYSRCSVTGYLMSLSHKKNRSNSLVTRKVDSTPTFWLCLGRSQGQRAKMAYFILGLRVISYFPRHKHSFDEDDAEAFKYLWENNAVFVKVHLFIEFLIIAHSNASVFFFFRKCSEFVKIRILWVSHHKI